MLNCISVKDNFYENSSTKGKLYNKNQFTVCEEKCMYDATIYRKLQFHWEKKPLHTPSFEGLGHIWIHNSCTSTQLYKTNEYQSKKARRLLCNSKCHPIKSCVQYSNK